MSCFITLFPPPLEFSELISTFFFFFLSHGPVTGTSREISPATAHDITVYGVAAHCRGPNQLSVICVACHLSLLRSHLAALLLSLAPSLSPFSLPTTPQSPKRNPNTVTGPSLTQLKWRPNCFAFSHVRASQMSFSVRQKIKKTKTKKINKRDAPLATEVTVSAAGPLPLPPPSRRAYGNDKQFFVSFFSPHREQSAVAALLP